MRSAPLDSGAGRQLAKALDVVLTCAYLYQSGLDDHLPRLNVLQHCFKSGYRTGNETGEESSQSASKRRRGEMFLNLSFGSNELEYWLVII